MAITQITDDNFRETYEKSDIVVLDFWADWCGPCKSYAPIYETVAQKFPDIVFGKVDTESEQKLAGYFEIRGIPTTIIIRDQLELFRHSGVIPEDALTDVVTQIKNADMDDVRKKIEAEDQDA